MSCADKGGSTCNKVCVFKENVKNLNSLKEKLDLAKKEHAALRSQWNLINAAVEAYTKALKAHSPKRNEVVSKLALTMKKSKELEDLCVAMHQEANAHGFYICHETWSYVPMKKEA